MTKARRPAEAAARPAFWNLRREGNGARTFFFENGAAWKGQDIEKEDEGGRLETRTGFILHRNIPPGPKGDKMGEKIGNDCRGKAGRL